MFVRKEEESTDKESSVGQQQVALGEKLIAAREEKGYSHDDIVAELNIRAVFLKAMEEGDFDALPSGVYRKTYVKTYIEFLGLENTDVLTMVSVDGAVNDNSDNSSASAGSVKIHQESSRPSMVAYVVAFLIIGGVYFVWNMSQNEAVTAQATQDVVKSGEIEGILAASSDVIYEILVVVTEDVAVEVLDVNNELVVSKELKKGQVFVVPSSQQGNENKLYLSSTDGIELYINGDYVDTASALATFNAEGKYVISLKPSELFSLKK